MKELNKNHVREDKINQRIKFNIREVLNNLRLNLRF